jgi:hypothetical protein
VLNEIVITWVRDAGNTRDKDLCFPVGIINDVNNLTKLVTSHDQEIGNTGKSHRQTVGISLINFCLLLEKCNKLIQLVVRNYICCWWHIHQLHIIEFKDTRMRNLPVVLHYEQFGIKLLISETRLITHLRPISSLSCSNSLSHLLIHNEERDGYISLDLICKVEFIVAIWVPIVKVVRATHFRSYLSQESSLCFREVRNHSKPVMSVCDSIHQ